MITTQGIKGYLEANYPMTVVGITPVTRNLFRVQTGNGYQRLARIHTKPSQLIFAYSAATMLRDRGFERVLHIYLTKEGQPFFEAEHSYWVLMDWVDGRNPEVRKSGDVEQVTRDLARLHRYMMGILPAAGGKSGNKWQDWPEKMMEGRKILQAYLKRARRSLAPSDFDKLLMKDNEDLAERIEQSLQFAMSLTCQQLMQDERNERAVAYQAIKEKEFLLGFDGRIYFLNPLKVEYDLRVKDLGDWIKRIVKKSPEYQALIPKVIQWYEEERPLSRGEKVWLLSYLLYPAKLVKIIERYMLKKKRWAEEGYVRKLRKSLELSAREMEAYYIAADCFHEVEEV